MKDNNFNITVLLNYLMADKPEWMTSIARLVMIELLLVSRLEKQMRTKPSLKYLADRCGVYVQAIEKALKLLYEYGWVVKVNSGKSKRITNTYAVQVSALPVSHMIKRTELSADAYNIAQRYFELVKALPKHKSKSGTGRMVTAHRTQPDWRQNWGFHAQNWLDEGHTLERINQVVDAFLQHRPQDARIGMQALKHHFTEMLELSKPVPQEVPMEEISI